jgi:hypothetical protein
MKQKKSINKETTPVLIKLLVNLVLTLGLSVSMYLLFSNILLTFHKISMQAPFLTRFHDSSSNSMPFEQTEMFPNKKYYDCTKTILSIEECDLINEYHDSFLRYFKIKLFSTNENKLLEMSGKNLTINTTFFTY